MIKLIITKERKMFYMNRNDMKKLTFEDKWYRLYTKGAGHRQHKSDKHWNHRKFRNLNKKVIDKEQEE